MVPAALASRLAVLRESRSVPEAEIEKLGRFLAEAADEELFRMSPLVYAEKAGLGENEAIDLFLRATRAGLMDFTWGVLCSACAAFLTTAPALKSLAARRRCAMCELDAPVTDDTVEVAFTVSPAVRHIRFHELDLVDLRRDWRAVHFSPSRMISQEVAAALDGIILDSWRLKAGEKVVIERTLDRRHLVFAPAHHATSHLNVKAGSGKSEASIDLVDGAFVPEGLALRPGPVRIEVANRSSGGVALGLAWNSVPPPEERGDQPPAHFSLRPYLTGKRLVTHETFRELFRAESIPSEGGLEFKSITVLFTDLKGSTELYERVGDMRAYGLVREHFHVLRDIIAGSGGSMVKTIGDAVMASFAEPLPALKAATEMTRRVRQVGSGGELKLKVGLHAGPCIAVESNERLDYFGQTVNIAARVQGAAAADEIVVTDSVFGAPGAQDVIRSAALRSRTDRALLKGVDGEVTLHRLS